MELKMKIQFINENKRLFENWKEKSIKITKIDKWWTKKKKKVVCKTARRAHSQKISQPAKKFFYWYHSKY